MRALGVDVVRFKHQAAAAAGFTKLKNAPNPARLIAVGNSLHGKPRGGALPVDWSTIDIVSGGVLVIP